MTAAGIFGIGACAPGMLDWQAAREVLLGKCPWRTEPLPKLDVPLLPAIERRRVSPAARIAITAATQAVAAWPAEGRAAIASVFATADGDGNVLACTLQTLSEDASAMSPTLFHNSVFNAQAGYWTIASQSRAPSTTVSAGAGSLAAGVLEALTQLAVEKSPVLLVAADLPFPPALSWCDVTGEPFACALLLVPANDARDHAYGTIRMTLHEGDAHSDNDAIEGTVATAFRGNAAARALPLLAAIARGVPAVIDLPYVDGCRARIAYAP